MKTSTSPQQPFIQMEHKWLAHWEKTKLVDKYRAKNANAKKKFSFMDGPITANNPMGVHHAWGRTYKDLWQKFHNLHGHHQRFQNGFDCQGLWVEVEVEKELGLQSKKDIENLVPNDTKASIAKFVQLCKDRVHTFATIQTKQSKRLGYFMDWENSYYTMSDQNNYMIWHLLKTCHDHGWIYKGYDSVPWCPRCGTAISQHEILTEDYKELTHETVYFKLALTKLSKPMQSIIDLNKKSVFFLAWTTTPWTVPGNVALAVNTDLTYVLAAVGEYLLILAKDRAPEVLKKHPHEVQAELSGKDLVGAQYEGPFDDLPRVQTAHKEAPQTFHTVVDGTAIVTADEGTGILHVAPGQGQEDFQLGKKEGLPIIDLIDEDASYYEELGALSGTNAKEKPGIIFAELKQRSQGRFFFKTQSYKHRYPRCWRCKTELVWRVVEEWYIAMDQPSRQDTKDTRTLRQRMIDVAKKITWIPSFGLDRELDWLNNMHDWMISKKRFWGLALPIWVSEDGEEFEVIGSKQELKERADKGWENFEGKSPHRPYIDDITIISKRTGKHMHRIPDVGNVWLDAGIVPFSTITDPQTGELAYLTNKTYFDQWFPVDFITESFPGQFKNWFYSLIAMGTVLENTNPFHTVLGFATMVDEKGNPFHKSAGNAIEFVEAADRFGADLIRWVTTSHNPAQNIRFGEKAVQDTMRNLYLTLWNVYKFYTEYAAIEKISPPAKDTPQEYNHVLDTWIRDRIAQTEEQARTGLSIYAAHTAAEAIQLFVRDLSTWYLRRSRDRVWIHTEDPRDKQSFYHTLYSILVDLSVLISPFMPFISEEMYTSLTKEPSVHLASWPIYTHKPNFKLLKDMETVRTIVEEGHRIRKEKKIKVRQPLAEITVQLPPSQKFLIKKHTSAYQRLIAEELNVKKVTLTETTDTDLTITYDTTLTEELIQEGKLRDLIRSIQAERKKQGIQIHEKVNLTIPAEFEPYTETIQRSVYTDTLTTGDSIRIEKP